MSENRDGGRSYRSFLEENNRAGVFLAAATDSLGQIIVVDGIDVGDFSSLEPCLGLAIAARCNHPYAVIENSSPDADYLHLRRRSFFIV